MKNSLTRSIAFVVAAFSILAVISGCKKTSDNIDEEQEIIFIPEHASL